ncbi:alpha/beta hydrolase [Ramlibacter sp. AN1015]|uniref:alpha/beta hydrolase n=1 Tax=Ramlibacter sp. AN1015 TaxID=3133428 RepID=UPI0030C2BD22
MAQDPLRSIAEDFRRLYAGWGPGTTIGEMRRQWDTFLRSGHVAAELEPVDANGVPCRWVRAPGASRERAIVYLHGGGYQVGSLDSHHNVMVAFSAASGCSVLGIDYRLAPEHRFPAPVEDSLLVWRWLLARGFTGEQVGIAGDSAGAGIAVALMTLLRDKSLPLPAAAVAMSPWVDMEASGASYARNAARDPVTQRTVILQMARTYLGKMADPREPLASPIHANLARLPPLLVQVGSDEVLLDDAVQLVERAASQGTDARLSVWNGMVHVFQLFTGRLPEADAAIEQAATFLRAAMDSHALTRSNA